ncbi:hypothetical protein T492DRAFT_962223 [Pavlovales sp. CCMP2436]|nr:hypothetical protein T492DRAFT_962223 [Pavlovales sp. CCMP2436]
MALPLQHQDGKSAGARWLRLVHVGAGADAAPGRSSWTASSLPCASRGPQRRTAPGRGDADGTGAAWSGAETLTARARPGVAAGSPSSGSLVLIQRWALPCVLPGLRAQELSRRATRAQPAPVGAAEKLPPTGSTWGARRQPAPTEAPVQPAQLTCAREAGTRSLGHPRPPSTQRAAGGIGLHLVFALILALY